MSSPSPHWVCTWMNRHVRQGLISTSNEWSTRPQPSYHSASYPQPTAAQLSDFLAPSLPHSIKISQKRPLVLYRLKIEVILFLCLSGRLSTDQIHAPTHAQPDDHPSSFSSSSSPPSSSPSNPHFYFSLLFLLHLSIRLYPHS